MTEPAPSRPARRQVPSAGDDDETTAAPSWVRTWGAAPEKSQTAVGDLDAFSDVTLRQVVRTSGGGRRVRVRFTNEYGTTPLTIGAAHLGIAATNPTSPPRSQRSLTFSGQPGTTVPAGAPVLSDPLEMSLPALSRLCIDLYVPGRVDTPTCHGTSAGTGWMVPGETIPADQMPDDAVRLPVQALLSAVEVVPDGARGDTAAAGVVVLGDSITDGFGSDPDTDRRWTDLMVERAVQTGLSLNVSNQGICGNRLLNDGIGASALARFDRDALATPGLSHLIVFAGINDLAVTCAPRGDPGVAEFLSSFPGGPVSATDLAACYRQLIARARDGGVHVYGATLTPYGGSALYSPSGEAARQTVNAWIRTSGAFDAVLDFDAAWRNVSQPSNIRDGLHAGDHLHGSDAGYQALADSVDLTLFR